MCFLSSRHYIVKDACGVCLNAWLCPCLTTGVLRLNKHVLSMIVDNHSYCYLLPKQTYLNVDEDAARTLERKRNYMYCLIVQIMKTEKQMHIDNLVFRVRPHSLLVCKP